MPLFVMTGQYLAELDQDLLQEHIAWLTRQFEDGVFLVSGAVDGDTPAALAILEAPSADAALAILDTEPFFRAGAIRHSVAPFHARVLADNLDARFTTEDLIRTVSASLDHR